MRQEHAQVSLELSVVIPAHDEAARILPHLRSIVAYLSTTYQNFEMIVVDDGSRDDTAGIVRRFALEYPSVRLIRLPACTRERRRRPSWDACRTRAMAVVHGCGRRHAQIRELARLQLALESGAQIAIGSRSLASRRSDFSVKPAGTEPVWAIALTGSCGLEGSPASVTHSVDSSCSIGQSLRICFLCPASTGTDSTWNCSISPSAGGTG